MTAPNFRTLEPWLAFGLFAASAVIAAPTLQIAVVDVGERDRPFVIDPPGQSLGGH